MKYFVREKDLSKDPAKRDITILIGNFSFSNIFRMFKRIKRYNKLYGKEKFLIKRIATDIDGNRLYSHIALYAVVNSQDVDVNTFGFTYHYILKYFYS